MSLFELLFISLTKEKLALIDILCKEKFSTTKYLLMDVACANY